MTAYTPTPGGPRPGHHRSGPARTGILTPKGYEAVRKYRRAAALAARAAGHGDEWRCYTVYTMIGRPRKVWRRVADATAQEVPA